MRPLAEVFILWAVLVATSALAASDYYTFQEYAALHPEIIEKAKRFSERVRNRGEPIATAKIPPEINIAIIYPGKQVSDYWRRSVVSLQKRLDEIAIPSRIDNYMSAPGIDYRTQEAQLRKALSNDPDYLVFTLDAKKHQRAIERIMTRKRPRLILQNITTPLKTWEGRQPFFYVGFDHASGTQMLTDFFLKKTGGRGKYAVLFFTMGYVSKMRGNTFIDDVRRRSQLQLVDAVYTDGNRGKACARTLNILDRHPDIAFLYCCSTDVAMGAIDALQQTGKNDDILVNGWGGGSSELGAIEKGMMDVTIMRMNDDNGVAMAEAIRLDLENRLDELPPVYTGDFVIVEKGIANAELNRLKAHAFRYSGVN